MIVAIKDINTGKTVDKFNGLRAIKQLDNSCDLLAIKTAARKLFDATTHNENFVYWVAVSDGVALHKGQF